MLGLSEFGTTEQFDFDKDEEVEDNDEEEDEQQALVIWFWFFFVFLVSFFGFGYLIFGFDFLGLGICSGFDFFSKQICSPLVPALSEPGKIEMYSPASTPPVLPAVFSIVVSLAGLPFSASFSLIWFYFTFLYSD